MAGAGNCMAALIAAGMLTPTQAAIITVALMAP